MATDRREEILSRLVAIAQALDGIETVARNREDISGPQRPAIIIQDADESADDRIKDRSRAPGSPNIMYLAPEIHILVGARAASVGSDLSAIRKQFLIDFFADARSGTIRSLIGNSGNAFYDGCSTDFGRERNMSGTMVLSLQINYPFSVDELAEP